MLRIVKTMFLLVILAPCGKVSAEEKTSKAFDESVHTLELTFKEVKVPPGPNQDVFVANCAICHSLRYITMQPAFGEKKWTDEVAKMIKVFGAPIKEGQAQEIVKYLVATHSGKK